MLTEIPKIKKYEKYGNTYLKNHCMTRRNLMGLFNARLISNQKKNGRV